MLVKKHGSYRDVIAICDSELLGKRFEEGNLQLEITDFFNGDEKTEKEALEIMKDAEREDATFNIVGEKAVSLAIKSSLVSKEGIRRIQGIPFALVLL